MLLAEMWSRGAVSASDGDVQRSLGVTRNRLTELLRSLAAANVLVANARAHRGTRRATEDALQRARSVSQPILTLLREHAAFKPKPPEYELAIAHVPLGQVGLEKPIDDRVLEAMCSDDESFTIVLAPPGCGKPSALSAAAMHCAGRSSSTTNNSRASSALTTTKAAPGSAGITTPPWSPPSTGS